MRYLGRAVLSLVFIMATNYTDVLADYLVNLDKVISIESDWKADAYNKKSKARGLGQITPIALQDYNNLNPNDKYTYEQLDDPQINQKITYWTLTERIPQMLRHFNVPVTTDNILWSYNAGIGRVVEGKLPEETRKYIQKYHALKE